MDNMYIQNSDRDHKLVWIWLQKTNDLLWKMTQCCSRFFNINIFTIQIGIINLENKWMNCANFSLQNNRITKRMNSDFYGEMQTYIYYINRFHIRRQMNKQAKIQQAPSMYDWEYCVGFVRSYVCMKYSYIALHRAILYCNIEWKNI